eukprot:COSAG02_NODE_43026_length_378_cov_12.379928_1_plen_46_part_01
MSKTNVLRPPYLHEGSGGDPGRQSKLTSASLAKRECVGVEHAVGEV